MQELVIIEAQVSKNFEIKTDEAYKFYDRVTKQTKYIPVKSARSLMRANPDICYNAVYNPNIASGIEIEGRRFLPEHDSGTEKRMRAKSVIALKKINHGYLYVDRDGKEKCIADTDLSLSDLRLINITKNDIRILRNIPLEVDNSIEMNLSEFKKEMIKTELTQSIVDENKPWNLKSSGTLYIDETGVRSSYDIMLNKIHSIHKKSRACLCTKFLIRSGPKRIPDFLFFDGIIEQFNVGKELEYIGQRAFEAAKRLKKLDLRKYSRISELHLSSFRSSGIQELYCPDNCGIDFFSQRDIKMEDLRILSLPKNLRILEIGHDSFESFKNLEILILPETKCMLVLTQKQCILKSNMKEIWTSPENKEIAYNLSSMITSKPIIKLVKRN